jgi:membrane-associated protease RseP (regulator of RpoE activity)
MLQLIRRVLPVVAGSVVLGLCLVAITAWAQAPTPQKKGDGLPLPIPDLEKLLPPGTIDPDQLKDLMKLLEGQHEMMRKLMDDLNQQFPGGLPNLGMPNVFGKVEQTNRLGAELQKPSRTLVDQLDLPEKQGIVLKTVKSESAAAKAGMKANDILLELNGKAVSSEVDDFIKQLNDIKKNTAVDGVVLRKGKREAIKGLKLGDVPAPANRFGGLGGLGGNLPNLQMLPMQQLPAFGGGQRGVNMSTSRGPDGAFTTKYKEGDVAITINGKMENKKADVASIEIRDSGQTNKYKSVDDVPEDLRDDVRALIRSVEQGGTLRGAKGGIRQ